MVKIEISGTCWETRRAPKEIFILIMNNAQGPNHIFGWDKLSENLSSLPPTFFCRPEITFLVMLIKFKTYFSKEIAIKNRYLN
jgi:hypothetical protein